MSEHNEKQRILIVDDTPENLHILTKMLEEQYIVQVANSGRRALKIAGMEPYPDLILLDIIMPEMDGFEFCRQIKASEKLKDVPVIFISATDGIQDKIEAFSCGGVDYISKPFYLQEVQARVSAHLKLSALQLELAMQNESLKKANDELEDKVAERTRQLTLAYTSLKEETVEKEYIQEKIKHLAYHDHLTGLPNKLMFLEQLHQSISMADRIEKTFAVMFIDLDSFKMVNDTMGHIMGDQLLKDVAERLQKIVRKTDIIARIGGDEFIILVEYLDSPELATIVADKVLKCFDAPFTLDGQDFFLSASIGISLYPVDGQTPDDLVKNADIAMYRAKENGRNQYTMCSPTMKESIRLNMSLTNRLYRAIDQGELELYYQPQILSDTNRIVGVEALLRWNNPEMGMISPVVFIPIAEQTGLINRIGEWVLRTACYQNKKWQDAGYDKFSIAVNISIKQLQNINLLRIVDEILYETGLDSRFLELEVTESIAMKGSEGLTNILKAFNQRGISIAIDDFGTEYSSLSHLKYIPVNRIKIAMPFIHGLETNEKDAAITQTIIVLAKKLGMQVVAEGVETKRQLDFLNTWMCDIVQGFYFHRPMPANELESLLRKSRVADISN